MPKKDVGRLSFKVREDNLIEILRSYCWIKKKKMVWMLSRFRNTPYEKGDFYLNCEIIICDEKLLFG